MMRTLKFLLGNQLKRSRVVQPDYGFTLIELLVAMVLAFLVITPLLGFMLNIMDTDRREQAKANSEQEIQSALDYISRDLQQAVYIYDATGIEAIKNQLPPDPTGVDRVPVLVFWKRELVSKVISNASADKDDTYIYSLVAYYLIKDDNPTWSDAARIARWQIKDGVADASSVKTCTGYSGKYAVSDDASKPDKYCPSKGFASFSLDGIGTLEEKMNSWEKLSDVDYDADPIVLVDFIDQTLNTPDNPNNAPAKVCTDSVPNTASFNSRDTFKMTGFYACIDRPNTTAQVFLRGNALARLQNNSLNYSESKKTYFPNVSIRVQGRGYLYTR